MTVNRTFINFLVLLDCLNSLGHLPTLIQFVLYVTCISLDTNSNRIFYFSYVNGVDYICLLEAAYNQMITAMNRAIPVAIAVYR